MDRRQNRGKVGKQEMNRPDCKNCSWYVDRPKNAYEVEILRNHPNILIDTRFCTLEQAIEVLGNMKATSEYNLKNEQAEYRSHIDLQIFREDAEACEMGMQALKREKYGEVISAYDLIQYLNSLKEECGGGNVWVKVDQILNHIEEMPEKGENK